jgi:hypothetical protein
MSDSACTPLGEELMRTPSLGEDVVEISLLLPGWQASVLETVAHQRGVTAAAMVRHLLHDFLVGPRVRSGQTS